MFGLPDWQQQRQLQNRGGKLGEWSGWVERLTLSVSLRNRRETKQYAARNPFVKGIWPSGRLLLGRAKAFP
jgi:hypothetical protein